MWKWRMMIRYEAKRGFYLPSSDGKSRAALCGVDAEPVGRLRDLRTADSPEGKAGSGKSGIQGGNQTLSPNLFME